MRSSTTFITTAFIAMQAIGITATECVERRYTQYI
ncbi:hypothetical protein PgNI_06645 [Pyricularia grisea]|uniref:Uncharacterized protein n=1 Tax=Pyricularia grisea TaxID=148305 RepID=A0A6P8B674_PYRGI|nr:hypothetical protein PgNI_06645 [Pyricularia grisea]TLD10753.1 hypothetical protein PgNI_06645 [Pyricularia grisea]